MQFINEVRDEPRITTAQRWSQFLTIIWGFVALAVVFNVRNGVLNAVSTYTNNEAGIVALYPANWLLDEASTDYVFRIRDVQNVGFATTYRVALRPISPDTTARSIVDTLAMQRAQTLAAYRILATDTYPLSQDITAQQITYTYVETSSNPFLEEIPSVVVGIDVITISRGQAVIITLLSDAEQVEQNRD
ncbi:MAG: hypothetical protein AAF125_18765, partial [Chloroflexota bacterium]